MEDSSLPQSFESAVAIVSLPNSKWLRQTQMTVDDLSPPQPIVEDLSHMMNLYLLEKYKWKWNVLRILATLEAKTAKISNFWRFWPVIKKVSLQNVQKLLIWAVLASSVASILKCAFEKIVRHGCGRKVKIFFRSRMQLYLQIHRFFILVISSYPYPILKKQKH